MVPEEGASLWDWFWDLRSSQNPGFSGAMRVSNLELTAWLQVTGNILRREEVAILRALDVAYCSAVDTEAEAIRERETAG